MIFNVIKYLEDKNISYWTEGKNVTNGWVNVQCPFCSDTSNHGGFNLKNNWYNCWKCGSHSIYDFIMQVEDINFREAKQKFIYYTKNNNIIIQKEKVQLSEKLSLPNGTKKLKLIHKKYLIKRKFNPDLLEKKYNLLGTNYLGDFKFRLIVPIYYKNKMISFLGRDITGKSKLRYKNCSLSNQVVRHKDILYGIDDTKTNDVVIIVEGVTDCWRLGKGALATFGSMYTKKQMILLKNMGYKKIYIFFDNDKDAQTQAKNLAQSLAAFGIDVENILYKKSDAGNMKQKNANNLMRDLGVNNNV
jgi:5S rRNA maturation endonuclease (ribonuclease M5)